jgi:hypothetical protein
MIFLQEDSFDENIIGIIGIDISSIIPKVYLPPTRGDPVKTKRRKATKSPPARL